MRIEILTMGDVDEVVRLWHECKRNAYPYLPLEQTRTLEDDHSLFHTHILANCEVWVAKDREDVMGYLAMNENCIDRLYIRVDAQRRGVGSGLMHHAKSLGYQELRLFTHQKNISACAFYEKHEFKPARYGTSPPPESEPDVEYVWSATE